MKNRLIVALPAYNEQGNVERMIERWLSMEEVIKDRYGLGLEVAIVNDGSSDKTEILSKKLSDTYENVTLINHEVNKGLGEAVKTGVKYAIEHKDTCKYLCIMDCDNTQDPSYVLDMLKKTEDDESVDVVFASRYQKGAKVHGLAGYRHLTSIGARWIFKLLLPVKQVRDYTCGYRLYRTTLLECAYKEFGEEIIENAGFTCMVELLYKLNIIGATFAEIPFELHYDEKVGASKMKVIKTSVRSISLGIQLRQLGIKRRKR